MRKLEGIVKEIVDEMGYLKKREERFTDTNGEKHLSYWSSHALSLTSLSLDKSESAELRVVHPRFTRRFGNMADLPFTCILQKEIPH